MDLGTGAFRIRSFRNKFLSVDGQRIKLVADQSDPRTRWIVEYTPPNICKISSQVTGKYLSVSRDWWVSLGHKIKPRHLQERPAPTMTFFRGYRQEDNKYILESQSTQGHVLCDNGFNIPWFAYSVTARFLADVGNIAAVWWSLDACEQAHICWTPKLPRRLKSRYSAAVTPFGTAESEAGQAVMVHGNFIGDVTEFIEKKAIIPLRRIDDEVYRFLRVKFIAVLFENPLANLSFADQKLGKKLHRELAREAIRKSLVPLKNGKSSNDQMLLPLPKKSQKILMIGTVCGAAKCVVVVFSGGMIVIEPYVGSMEAAWFPETEGQGVTDVLFCDYPFTGKLPKTWFKSVDQVPINIGDEHYGSGFGLTTGSASPTTGPTPSRLAPC